MLESRLNCNRSTIEGLEDFLLPPSFDALIAAADNGPIVFLNASQFGSDAIIMQPGGALHRVSLPLAKYKLLEKLKGDIYSLSHGHGITHDATEVLQQLFARGDDSEFLLGPDQL